MKKTVKMLVFGLLFSFTATAQDLNDFEIVNIENAAVQAYMADKTYENETGPDKWNTVVYDYSKNASFGKNLDWPAGKLVTWKPTTTDDNILEIRITVNNTACLPDEVGYEATHNPDNISDRSFVIRNLLPNCTYTYKVEEFLKNGAVNTLSSGMFETVGQVRMIQVRNAHNMRDIGGWKSQFGGTIRYGILYRSGSLETMNEKGRHDVKDNLNIRAELDLRQESNLKFSRLGKDAAFRLVPHDAGGKGLTQTKRVFSDDLRWILSLIMPEKYGQDKSAKPVAVDWHCAMGCDRCGTVSFLIEGLLGMSRTDICRDFELSSFKSGYNRPRSHMGGMFRVIYGFGPSDNLARCFYNYWLSLGMTEQELDDFINHMILFEDESRVIVSGNLAKKPEVNELIEIEPKDEENPWIDR